jgi:cation diffusion facilitator CzcD-associated flavoprotein CzcO
LQYIKKTADDFGLREPIRLNSRVTAAAWSEKSGKWKIMVEDLENKTMIEDEADVLVNGSGFLNSWKWPDIPGLKDFKGELVHSANWRDIDLAVKKVGLIGNGSTGVQILPQLQSKAGSVHTYIRSPTWIIPNFLGDHTPEGKNFVYTEEQKQRWREHPEELKELRKTLEHAFNQSFPLFIKDSPYQAGAREGFTHMMKAKLGGDEELAKKLIPDFEVGCRRITPGDGELVGSLFITASLTVCSGYLEALQAENVNMHFEPIVRFEESGIVSQSSPEAEPQMTELDVIVCATGFDVSYKPAWTMKGLDGKDLSEIWKDDSEAFMGIFAPEMPNYFTATGPNTPIGHGSIFGMIDATADYILKWCSKIASEGIK